MYKLSVGMRKIRNLQQFLSQNEQYLYHCSELYLGWGRKKSFFDALKAAQRNHKNCICLEDGFIRSMGLGKQGYTPLSVVVDRTGIYFDATAASDLENLIHRPELPAQILRAKRAIQTILDFQITKYNLRYDPIQPDQFSESKNILVVDQTFGDQSIHYAGASAESFRVMLKQAIQDHPDACIWVKIHPDVYAGRAKGHFDLQDLQHPNIRVLTSNHNPLELCRYMQQVYVVSSQLGFEALLLGKVVTCFGVPWYAGWGLTDDQHAPIHILQQRRHLSRSVEHLFACAYFDYARYVSPVSAQRCELEDILELFIPNLEFQGRLHHSSVALYGFSRWKRKFLKDFLDFPNLQLRFYQWKKPNPEQLILAWGRKATLLKQQGYLKVWTVEDGFVRSIGLGAKLIRPFSLVVDDIGIYYDATQPSRLEMLLNSAHLTDGQRERALQLQQVLVREQLTKYNVGSQQLLKREWMTKTQQRKILVVGQVEDDLSVQLGGVGIKTNLDLLSAVRKSHPDAVIIYKPHPDVEANLRKGKLDSTLVFKYANAIETESNILQLFEHIDEVHTISSLSGFEALLRNIPVHCYGLPFYAGWGLTQDLYRCERRHRQLDILELIYISLIEYPLYNLPQTNAMQMALACPEHVIQAMIHHRETKSSVLYRDWASRIFTAFRRFKIKS